MSTGLEQIRERVTEFLNSRGVSAVTAWPMAPRSSRSPMASRFILISESSLALSDPSDIWEKA